jgi:hypothetical protein
VNAALGRSILVEITRVFPRAGEYLFPNAALIALPP